MKKAPIASVKRKSSKQTTSRAAQHNLGTTIDLVAAILIVSLLINLFVVCIWVTLRVTTQYDDALAQFLLGR